MGAQQTARVVRLPIVDGLGVKPEQLPLSFPRELRDELLTHHSNPPVFFVAQFLHYLMKDNEKMRAYIAELEATIPFSESEWGIVWA